MSAAPDEIRTQPRPNCFLCGSVGRRLYEDIPSALFETPGRWSFDRCARADCGLIWMNPMPVESDLHKAYATYFTHGREAEPSANGGGLRDMLYSLYRLANYPGWLFCGIAREKRRRARMYLEDLKPGQLLDVGCGDGRFLSEMQRRGWTVDGIDFDAKGIHAAKRKYDLALRHGDLRQAALPPNHFDAVTMSHVIEHLLDPVGVLVEIRRILKPGGALIATTPNVESLGHRKFGSHWFGLDAPRHLNLYTADALRQTAVKAGFSKAKADSTSANADVFFGGSFTLAERQGHRMGHQPTPNVVRTLKAALWQYREHFALQRTPLCGEELVLLCTKD